MVGHRLMLILKTLGRDDASRQHFSYGSIALYMPAIFLHVRYCHCLATGFIGFEAIINLFSGSPKTLHINIMLVSSKIMLITTQLLHNFVYKSRNQLIERGVKYQLESYFSLKLIKVSLISFFYASILHFTWLM